MANETHKHLSTSQPIVLVDVDAQHAVLCSVMDCSEQITQRFGDDACWQYRFGQRRPRHMVNVAINASRQ